MFRVITTAILLTISGLGFAQETSQIEFEMKPRPTDEAEFPAYIEYLVQVAEPRTAEERKADEEIKAKYEDALIGDSLFVGAPGFPAGFSDEMYEEAIQHSIDNRFNLVSATATNGAPEDLPDVVEQRMIDTNAYWKERSDRYLQVFTVDDIQRARKAGKVGILHNS
jgi:hypothetical protein